MYPLRIIDSFAARPFSGNPAGVVQTQGHETDAWMLQVASELRHSETAFIGPKKESGHFPLRWFTPVAEVPLCGHATLAAAHALFESGLVAAHQTVHFDTLSGVLTAKNLRQGIELDFPIDPTEPQAVDLEQAKRIGLVQTPIAAARSTRGLRWLILELESPDLVRQARPNVEEFAQMGAPDLILTARNLGGATDIVSRVFAPSVGIPEDPVTGAAHCALADYWKAKLGRTGFQAEQASARGGLLEVEVQGERVLLRGKAITVVQGTLHSEG